MKLWKSNSCNSFVAQNGAKKVVTVLVCKILPPPKTSFVVRRRIAKKEISGTPVVIGVWVAKRFCWRAPRKNSAIKRRQKRRFLQTQLRRKRKVIFFGSRNAVMCRKCAFTKGFVFQGFLYATRPHYQPIGGHIIDVWSLERGHMTNLQHAYIYIYIHTYMPLDRFAAYILCIWGVRTAISHKEIIVELVLCEVCPGSFSSLGRRTSISQKESALDVKRSGLSFFFGLCAA